MQSLSDKELIKAFRASSGRDFRPFEILVQRYEPLVYRLCLRYFKAPEIAEDLSQEILLKVYNQLKGLEKPENFKGWILRVSSNLCADHYRKLKRRKEIQEQVAVEVLVDEKDSHEVKTEGLQNEKLIDAIEKLNDKDREIVSLHYFSELPIKEVAQSLGIGESAVKMRLSRCREKLLALMKKM